MSAGKKNDKSVPALGVAVKARIAEKSEDARKQHEHRARKAYEHLEREQKELGDSELPSLRAGEDNEIHDYKQRLSDEEVVVYYARRAYRDREYPAPPVVEEAVESREQQRKHHHRLVEVEEEHVVEREARERIEDSADSRVALEADVALQPEVRRRSGAGELQYQYRTDKVRHEFIRERDSQPEERTAHQIEAVAREGVGTEVGQVVPPESAVAHLSVNELIERDLLHVEIAEVEEYAVVIDYERHKQQQRHAQRGGEGQRQPVAAFYGVGVESFAHIITFL